MRFTNKALYRAASVAALVLFVSLSASSRAEMAENPAYQQWAKFGVGSYAKLKSVTTISSYATEAEITYKLVELTEEKAVVEMSSSMLVNGQKIETPASTMEYPAMIEKVETPEVEGEAPSSEEGEETLEVNGEKIPSKWTKSTIESAGTVIVSTVWTSESVPGGVVKVESTTTGSSESQSNTTLVEYEAK